MSELVPGRRASLTRNLKALLLRFLGDESADRISGRLTSKSRGARLFDGCALRHYYCRSLGLSRNTHSRYHAFPSVVLRLALRPEPISDIVPPHSF